jgi:hypothetical protein
VIHRPAADDEPDRIPSSAIAGAAFAAQSKAEQTTGLDDALLRIS